MPSRFVQIATVVPVAARHISAMAVLIVAMLCVVDRWANAGDVKPTTLRVLTYNIHHGEGTDGKVDLPRIAAAIRAANADLVALQEVDVRVQRTANVDQAVELANATEMNMVFHGNIELQGGQYGNAILSRFPITASRNVVLPNDVDGEQRGVLIASVTIPELASPLEFYCTHFDHRRPDALRVASAKVVAKLAVESKTELKILAGDLNDKLDSRTIQAIQQSWTLANSKPAPTIPVGKPQYQIDFVLTSPASAWRVDRVIVLDETVASDHRPLLAEVTLLSP
ncbi:MAG: endonuclease/exonuclease/phosphatase family protein [Pirellulaceae bacterium]|nr:endonuclease/exonuclease/phosphatase family protein [Planctomycetales bacterium]